jgi:hypothetical protein
MYIFLCPITKPKEKYMQILPVELFWWGRGLFLHLCPKMNTLNFGSWRCSCFQVKIPILSGQIQAANPTLCIQFRTLYDGTGKKKQQY